MQNVCDFVLDILFHRLRSDGYEKPIKRPPGRDRNTYMKKLPRKDNNLLLR